MPLYLAHVTTDKVAAFPDIRLADVEAVASLFDIPLRYPQGDVPLAVTKNVIVLELPSDVACMKLLSRSMSIKSLERIFTQAKGINALETLIEQLRTQHATYTLPEDLVSALREKESTFCVEVNTIGKKHDRVYGATVRNKLRFLSFQGTVSLSTPKHHFSVTIEFSSSGDMEAAFFTRIIGSGWRSTVMSDYRLNVRPFIGNTSMAPELAMFTANLAKVRSGDFVIDPFVGTGSILVACATVGAFVIGSDISSPTIRGNSEGATSADNFIQYDLQGRNIGVVIADSSKERSPWRKLHGGSSLFDAIVCDPPYGVREGARKNAARPGKTTPRTAAAVEAEEQGSTLMTETVTSASVVKASSDNCSNVSHEKKVWNFEVNKKGRVPRFKKKEKKPMNWFNPAIGPSGLPPTVGYEIGDVLVDLLDFAARQLRMGGRLAFWLPVVRDEYDVERSVPQHPCLLLCANVEQILSRSTSRRLIAMEKVTEPTDTATEARASTVNNTQWSSLHNDFRGKIYKQNHRIGYSH